VERGDLAVSFQQSALSIQLDGAALAAPFTFGAFTVEGAESAEKILGKKTFTTEAQRKAIVD
jgi:hypothetical protein